MVANLRHGFACARRGGYYAARQCAVEVAIAIHAVVECHPRCSARWKREARTLAYLAARVARVRQAARVDVGAAEVVYGAVESGGARIGVARGGDESFVRGGKGAGGCGW